MHPVFGHPDQHEWFNTILFQDERGRKIIAPKTKFDGTVGQTYSLRLNVVEMIRDGNTEVLKVNQIFELNPDDDLSTAKLAPRYARSRKSMR
jgi:hypothetical protein